MTDFPERRLVIIIHPTDNVATALEDLDIGSRLTILLEQEKTQLIVKEPIPRGHKISIKPIQTGMPVIKYGEQIGIAQRQIESGAHVHIHNVSGTRAQRK